MYCFVCGVGVMAYSLILACRECTHCGFREEPDELSVKYLKDEFC